MIKDKILVVDDEKPLCELMRDILEGEGYQVELAQGGRDGLRTFFNWRPTLVVTDILMPDLDGWQLLERIRDVSETPVIILSALTKEQDTVRGLRSGADDYMVKPVRLSEFVARVEATLRKSKQSSDVEEEYNDSVLQLDFVRHQVRVRGNKVDLSPQEFRLLGALVRNANLVPRRLR